MAALTAQSCQSLTCFFYTEEQGEGVTIASKVTPDMSCSFLRSGDRDAWLFEVEPFGPA
jgi:hypothetical protein